MFWELLVPMDQMLVCLEEEEWSICWKEHYLQFSMVGLGDALGLLCILWHWKPKACGRL